MRNRLESGRALLRGPSGRFFTWSAAGRGKGEAEAGSRSFCARRIACTNFNLVLQQSVHLAKSRAKEVAPAGHHL